VVETVLSTNSSKTCPLVQRKSYILYI
jgi:hypothetical protein